MSKGPQWLVLAALLASCAAPSAPPTATAPRIDAVTASALEKEVAAAERGFARAMAERNHAAFASFVAEDASFRAPDKVLLGKREVVDAWAAFFKNPQAPFSWDPDIVTVQADGRSALSTGPVKNPKGEVVGRFVSVWRKDGDGRWRIVLDQAAPRCN